MNTTSKLVHCQLCLSAFELYVMQRAAIKKQAADVLFRLETRGTDTTEVDHN